MADETANTQELWPQLLQVIEERMRFAWILLSQTATVLFYDGTTLTLNMARAMRMWARMRTGASSGLTRSECSRCPHCPAGSGHAHLVGDGDHVLGVGDEAVAVPAHVQGCAHEVLSLSRS